MSLKKKDHDPEYVKAFNDVSQKRSGKSPRSTMKACAIKMRPEERNELEELFDRMGLTFSSGVRHVLTEFKNSKLELK